MVKEIEDSLVRMLTEAGLPVNISLSDSTRKDDILTLAYITPEIFSIDDGVYSLEVHFYLNIVNDKDHSKLDKYLNIKSAAEKPFKLYDISSGTAVHIDDCTVSMPHDITFQVPFGDVFVDEIVIKIRRYK